MPCMKSKIYVAEITFIVPNTLVKARIHLEFCENLDIWHNFILYNLLGLSCDYARGLLKADLRI